MVGTFEKSKMPLNFILKGKKMKKKANKEKEEHQIFYENFLKITTYSNTINLEILYILIFN